MLLVSYQILLLFVDVDVNVVICYYNSRYLYIYVDRVPLLACVLNQRETKVILIPTHNYNTDNRVESDIYEY